MAAQVVEGGLAFLAGYACRANCSLPCQTRLASLGRPFKLSVVVHSANLSALEGGPGLVQRQRPYVGISVGERTKETELGDWSREKGQWCFRETITVVVEPDMEILLVASCSTQYDLYVAAVSLNSRRLGVVCFPVSALLPRLRAEDRDADGLVYATPIMDFDVVLEGRFAGRIHLSFETLTPPPPSQKPSDRDQCCGMSKEGGYTYRGEDDVSTAASSSGDRRGPVGLDESIFFHQSRGREGDR